MIIKLQIAHYEQIIKCKHLEEAFKTLSSCSTVARTTVGWPINFRVR